MENERQKVLRSIEEKAKVASPSAKNPHPKGSVEAEAWERGHGCKNLLSD